jgi:hypothetical protein
LLNFSGDKGSRFSLAGYAKVSSLLSQGEIRLYNSDMPGIPPLTAQPTPANELRAGTANPLKRVWSWQTWLAWSIFIIAITARLLPGARTIDDSFITYRYARNILAGNGFVYNPGEKVLGTTTPLYTGLLAICAVFSGGVDAPFVFISMLINALADGLTCLLLIGLGRHLGSPLAGIGTGLVWAIAPFSVTFAIGGLETSLYVLLLVAMISAHLAQRRKTTTLLAVLALLTRPDALILIGPLALDRLIEAFSHSQSKTPNQKSKILAVLPEAFVFLLPTLAWVILATLYFGSPLPHSIAAKSVAYRLDSTAGFIRLLQHYSTPFLGHLTFGTNWIRLGFVMYPFLFIVGARRAWRSNRRIWPFLAYPWLYFIIFSVANPLIFRWYMTPPLPAYMLAILLGVEQAILSLAGFISSKLASNGKKPSPPGSYSPGIVAGAGLVFMVILAPTLLSLRDWTLHPDHGPDRPAPAMAWYQLELVYRRAADLLAPEISKRQQAGENPVLAAGDVGVLGFYTGANILDTVGLNSPVSTRYYPADPSIYVGNYAVPPDLILDQKPDYIVILEVYGRGGLLIDSRFWQAYSLREKIATDIYTSDGMLILEKKPR